MRITADDRRRLATADNVKFLTAAAPTIEPMALPIPAACAASGISRSELYRQFATGAIRAVKQGRRTLVLTESLRNYMAALPPATFRAPTGSV